MRTIFKAISRFLLLSLLAVQVNGQTSPTATFHMERDGLVKWNDCVADIGSIYTISQAKAQFGAFYTRYMAEGQADPVTYPNHTDANFLKINEYSATWNNYVWAGHAAAHIHPQTGKLIPCQSRTNIEAGAGNYKIDYPLDFAFGHYSGHGSSVSYNGGTVQQGSTSLELDIANWVGNPSNQSIFIGATWGREDLSSYQEAFVLKDFRLIGSKTSEVWNSAIESSGIITWDPGSVSKIENIFAENFNTAGLHCVRGTSLSVENCTWFRSNLAGVYLEGGGMHCFYGVQEFDECPADFLFGPGHGRPGGSTFECEYVKHEGGIAPGRATDKDGVLFDGEGWGNIHFGSVSYSNVSGFQYTMARWNATVNSSSVKIDNLVVWGPLLNIFHDLANNKVCRMDGVASFNGYYNTAMHDLKWTNLGGGQFKFDFVPSPDVRSSVSDARYESILTDPNTGSMVSSYDEVNGKPAYKYGQYAGVVVPPPPPAPCTGWTVGAWSTCTNGTQTRTVTPSPAGCTGTPTVVKPAESQTCTTTTPTWTVLWDGSKVTPANQVTATTCTAVNATVTKIRLTNWTPSANAGRIVGTGTTTATPPAPLPSLELYNGDFYYKGAKIAADKITGLTGKVVPGTKYASVVITLPEALAIKAVWQVKCETGWSWNGACPGTCEKLEGQ